jgi:hypothetical protein
MMKKVLKNRLYRFVVVYLIAIVFIDKFDEPAAKINIILHEKNFFSFFLIF